MQQPMQQPMGMAGPAINMWFPRFDCFADMGACCLSFWCSCVVFGLTMERAGVMGCCPAACALITPPIVGYVIEAIIFLVTGINVQGLLTLCGAAVAAYFGMSKRKQMAQKYNLKMEGDLNEFCCWFCCECCTIIQEYRTITANVDANGNWVGTAIMPAQQVQVTVVGAQQPVAVQAPAPAAVADVPDKAAEEAAPPGGGAEPPAYGVAAPPVASRACC